MLLLLTFYPICRFTYPFTVRLLKDKYTNADYPIHSSKGLGETTLRRKVRNAPRQGPPEYAFQLAEVASSLWPEANFCEAKNES